MGQNRAGSGGLPECLLFPKAAIDRRLTGRSGRPPIWRSCEEHATTQMLTFIRASAHHGTGNRVQPSSWSVAAGAFPVAPSALRISNSPIDPTYE